jgi:hypothetical protein
MKSKIIILFSIGMIILFISFIIINKMKIDETKTDETKIYETENSNKIPYTETKKDNFHLLLAYKYMEIFVKQNLISPGTAKFPGVFDGKKDHIKYLGGERYRIVSWVDSQNVFGANIRTFFAGEIEQIGENEFALISLNILTE